MKFPFKCQPLFFPKQIKSKQKHCVLHLALRLKTMISPSPGPWSVQPSTQAELFGKAQCFSSWNGGGSISLAVCRGDSFKTLKSKHWQNGKLFPSSLWRYFKHWNSPEKGYGMASWSNQKVEVTSDPMISYRNKNLALGLCVVCPCLPTCRVPGPGIPSLLLILLFKMYLILPFFIPSGLV